MILLDNDSVSVLCVRALYCVLKKNYQMHLFSVVMIIVSNHKLFISHKMRFCK